MFVCVHIIRERKRFECEASVSMSGFGAFGPGTSRESLSEEGQVVEEDGRDDSTLSPTVGRVVLVHMPVHCTVQCICQLAG